MTCPRCEELEAERDELATRLISTERERRLAMRALREMTEEGSASYVVALLAQIERLEKNIQTLSKRKA